MTVAVERELKVAVPDDFVVPPADQLVPGCRLEPLEPLQLHARYHDTAELALLGHGATLRRRTGEGATRWTLKLPVGQGPTGTFPTGTLSRDEIDVVSDGQAVPDELAELVAGWSRGRPLLEVARVHTRRERWALWREGRRLGELCDDRVDTEAVEGRARFREIEVELESGVADGDSLLAGAARALGAAGASTADPTPKLARALAARLGPV